ncbi:hypothetical protein GCM10018962_43460 [Dactylosporangium matsuzakiense]
MSGVLADPVPNGHATHYTVLGDLDESGGPDTPRPRRLGRRGLFAGAVGGGTDRPESVVGKVVPGVG